MQSLTGANFGEVFLVIKKFKSNLLRKKNYLKFYRKYAKKVFIRELHKHI